MDILGNVFVKKAIKSMVTPEQFSTMQNFMTAVQSGKIDNGLLKRVGEKVSKMTPDEINKLLELVDKGV